MYNPIATYRLQFNKAFTFTDFERIIPYLQKLGVSTVYASPIFDAVPGSMHGYDGVNTHRINREIGSEEQLKDLTRRLREEGMGWVQDIVPNHMAFHPDNHWLMDVLEKGKRSVYLPFFDIDWESPVYEGRLMVPFLGGSLEEIIAKFELKVAFSPDHNRLGLCYFDAFYPINPHTYTAILQNQAAVVPQAIQDLLVKHQEACNQTNDKAFALVWAKFRKELAVALAQPEAEAYLNQRLEQVNQNPELILQIANAQPYRLCSWKETDEKINYRRFFTINGLICLQIQDPDVFDYYHKLIKALLDESVLQGLRVDHIDGLYAPAQYLRQLRELAGEEAFLVVEKILQTGEVLPSQWPVQGNTGYDFLAVVNNLLTNRSSQKTFSLFYQKLTHKRTPIIEQIREKKENILSQHMGGELENLYRLFQGSNLIEKKALASVHKSDMKAAIGSMLVHCPVYRYYADSFPLQYADALAMQDVFCRIRQNDPDLQMAVTLLEEALLHKPQAGDEAYNKRVLHFYSRCMQFTGSLMAKGVEDTLMYTYNHFIGHNEVGDSPESFGISLEVFNKFMQDRQMNCPLSLNATATHDTKRGEDVRARLNVLTDMADEWIMAVKDWVATNAGLKQDFAPDANDEYLIYQHLISTYPMPGQTDGTYTQRMEAYLEKALREAKLHSNWTKPDDRYEQAVKAFAISLLDPNQPFWPKFEALHRQVADYGIVNSLAQVLLKFTCPGVPDVYQGNELWDLSMVDPDNRRPVAFDMRAQWLADIESQMALDAPATMQQLWLNRYDGRIKLWLVQHLLQQRKNFAELFAHGEYIPLSVEGKHKAHVLAFARRHKQQFYVVAVPLHVAQLCSFQQKSILEIDWADTHIVLPKGVSPQWENLLLATESLIEKGIAVQDLFNVLPLAVLRLEQQQHDRSAGILLHISSLPSPFGIGDIGPEARNFVNFLQRSHQKCWQFLPLGPTEAGQGYSPYSSFAAMAGNTMFISPEMLAKDGLLNGRELYKHYLPAVSMANFDEAKRVKETLFEEAWQAFKAGYATALQAPFDDFCKQEANWLHDYALYVVLKQQFEGRPWFDWPTTFKLRNPQALKEVASAHADALNKAKWLQFVLLRQWKSLRAYCDVRGIQLLGDMPFYVSYDSVDVWANQKLFSLTDTGDRWGVAGVPPDSFSDDGQLWGMPIFKWDVLKEQGYDWWVGRLRKSIELFDLVRIDHFRAFADYWEVPAAETTAKNGKWVVGPRNDFFDAMLQAFGSLPLVAEDLGEINDAVYDLRDAYRLPGMKVLQFAFGDDMPQSDYLPQNYGRNFIAYTGTHDNNTCRGWYRQDTNDAMRNRLNQYLGMQVTDANVHHVMGRMVYASVANTVILPIQDVLGLDESARMNKPGSAGTNWCWRLTPGQLNTDAENLLKEWTWLYNRM